MRRVCALLALCWAAQAAEARLPAVPADLELTEDRPLLWRLELAAGDLLRLRLEQLDVDVAIELLAPDGAELRREDVLQQPFGHEELWWVVETAGVHQVRVVSTEAGKIRLKVAEARLASDEDHQRVRAEHLLSAGRGSAKGDRPQLEQGLGDLRKARGIFEALSDDDGACRCLRFEGQLLRRLGRLSEAEERLERCATLAESKNLPDHLAAAHLDLSAVFHSRGDYAAALVEVQTSLAIAERSGLKRQIVEARASAAMFLARLGRRHEALPLQREVVADARHRHDKKDLAYALVNLGANLYNLGDNARALEALREARDLLQALGLERQAALVLSNLATVLETLGDVEAAQVQNARALAARQQLGDLRGQAASRVNLGDGYRQLGRPGEAEEPYRRAIDLYVEVEDRWGEGFARAQLGAVLVELERDAEALDPLRRALGISRELGHRDTEADALASLSRIATRRGDRSKARQLLEEMVAAALARADPYREARARHRLALLALDEGRRTDALIEIERAVERVESVRARAGSERLRASYLHRVRSYYDLWIDLLMRDGATDDDRALAFSVAERAKARGLLDLLAETRGGARLALGGEVIAEVVKLEGEVRSLQERWRTAVSALASTSAANDPDTGDGTQGATARDLHRQLEAALGDLELARQAVRRQHPRYAEVFEPEPLDLSATTALLDSETLMLAYHVGGERSWLFLVTQQSLEVHPLPGEAELAERVTSLRRLVASRGRRSEGRFAVAAGEFWQLLLGPAQASMEKRKRLLVVADGPLRTLPFEVLIDPRSPAESYAQMPFLIRKMEIAYAPSASVLAGLADRRSEARRWPLDLVAYADPVLPSAENSSSERGAAQLRLAPSVVHELGRLPGSAEEAETIAALFPTERRRVLTAEAALESRLKKDRDLRQARYLHFATHGLVDPVVPARSALVLSSADEGEDGLLQAFEIVDLELSADLVTLSACETGLGRLYRGEGLLGLTRAFVYAGADRVLASLWRVSDASTRELMTEFYAELRQDPSHPAASLRRAKLRLIERPDRAHPYAWAPFVLIGG